MNCEYDIFAAIAMRERRFAALYRRAAATFGLPETTLWVLYFAMREGGATQQDIVSQLSLPKQTVNSAVAALAKRGLVELSMIPGTRNLKRITLTAEGEELAGSTVRRMADAEQRAFSSMPEGHMEQLLALQDELASRMEAEFDAEGI